MPDQTMTCRDCNTSFEFTEREQEFFKEKGFNPPVRCPDCRRKRKAEKESRGGGGQRGGY
jgi:hypothetical protein